MLFVPAITDERRDLDLACEALGNAHSTTHDFLMLNRVYYTRLFDGRKMLPMLRIAAIPSGISASNSREGFQRKI